jgi:hypothetical protein
MRRRRVSAVTGERYSGGMDEQESPLPPPLPWSVRVRRYFKRLVVRVLIYLLAYLLMSMLTIGPMFWYWFEAVHADGSIWVAKFYAPLLWLCDHCNWLSELVNRYINWWIL